MHYPLKTGIGIVLLSFAFSNHAEQILPENIPQKVTRNILERHPGAHDLHAETETHFGKLLLEVAYKDENGKEIFELFTQKGHLFSDEYTIEDFRDFSAPVTATLKREFPGYKLKKAQLVTNPNGAGEEYDIYLTANGVDWKVLTTSDGTLKTKEQLTP